MQQCVVWLRFLQNPSTCFGCPPHSLSWVLKIVTAPSGTGHHTCTATSTERGQFPTLATSYTSERLMYRSADKSLALPGRQQANVSVRMAWISFGALPCRKKKNLMTARVSMLLKSRTSLTCFRACFLPGRAKDLSAQYSARSSQRHYIRQQQTDSYGKALFGEDVRGWFRQ